MVFEVDVTREVGNYMLVRKGGRGSIYIIDSENRLVNLNRIMKCVVYRASKKKREVISRFLGIIYTTV